MYRLLLKPPSRITSNPIKARNHTIDQQYLELTLIKHWPNGSSIASGLAKTPGSTQAHTKSQYQVAPNICTKFPTFNNRTGKW